MENQVDLFLTAFVAGVCGGAIIMFAMASHFKYIYSRYLEQRGASLDLVALRRIEYDIQKIKLDIGNLNKEIYK
jgi:hypothetical protein